MYFLSLGVKGLNKIQDMCELVHDNVLDMNVNLAISFVCYHGVILTLLLSCYYSMLLCLLKVKIIMEFPILKLLSF